jgi:hypothetical protein
VKFSSIVSIQIFSLKNANPSINEIHVENNYFPLPSKFEMNTLPCFWVDLAKTYLEARVAQHWQNVAKTLELEGKDAKVWMFFKDALIKAYGNINLEQLAHTKLSKLTHTSSVENYANKFQNLYA